MSISSEISRISGNVSDALTAIANKGVTVPSGSNSDDLATLIAAIETGGGGGTRTTIVPEQTANYTERYNQLNYLAPLVVGETYIYTIDGVESQSLAFDNYGTVAIGQPDATIGFEYTGSVMYLSIADSSLRTTHTVKVEQESSGSGGDSATLITKTISANGTYSASDDSADGYSSVTVSVPTGSGKNIQYSMGRYEVSATSYTATSLSITVSKAGTYKCYWVMDRNTTSGTSGSQLYKNGEAVGSAHTSWTYNGNNRNGISCEETLTLAANDVLVARARSRNTSYICGVSNLIIIEQ